MGIHMNKSQRMCLLLIGALVILVASCAGLSSVSVSSVVDLPSEVGFQSINELDSSELFGQFSLAVRMVVPLNVVLLIGYGVKLVRVISVFAAVGDAIALLQCGRSVLWILIPSVRPGVYLEYQADYLILAVLIFAGVVASLYVAIKGLVDPALSYGGSSRSVEAEVQQLRAEIDELKGGSSKA